MKKYLVSVFIFTIITVIAFAQNDYYPIQSEGDIPQDFIKRTSAKIAKANQSINKDGNLSIRQHKEYNSISNFQIDLLLKSGKIVFGTSMNDYVNKVGEYILQYFPNIKDDIRFYIVKSPQVNAFTTQQGIIFINIGLIAQLENEAQLAFVLSHEIIHYKYKHNIESYTEQILAESDWGDYGKLSRSKKESRLIKFSHKHEFTADSLGFLEAFSKTEYSYDEALTLFDVLLYSSLPFDEIEFDSTFFDDDNYKIESKYILKDIKLISSPEDYDDTHSSHPNIKKRRSAIIDLITEYENKNKKTFIVSEKDFKNLQKEARFEMSNLYISDLQYDKAFYNSYLLLRKYPKNKYLKRTMAYILYSLAQHKKQGGVSQVIRKYKKVEGQSQRLSYFFKKIKSKTLTSLAVKSLWNYHKENPKDVFMNNLLEKAMYLNIKSSHISFDKIYAPSIIKTDTSITTDSTVTKKTDFVELTDEEYNKLSKYNKIRYDKKYREHFGSRSQNKKVKKTTKIKNYYFVLSTESADIEFEKKYKAIERQVNKETNNYDEEEDIKIAEKLNIRSFTLVNPLYLKIDNNRLIINDFEKKKEQFTQTLCKMGTKKNIKVDVADIMGIRYDEVDKFNDLALMNAWMSEYEDLKNTNSDANIIPWQGYYLRKTSKRLGMQYIATSGLLEASIKRSSGNIFWNVLLAVPFWYASPYFLSNVFTKHKKLLHYFYLIDIETNEIILTEQRLLNGTAGQDFINSLNYNIMYQLEKK